MSDSSTNSNAKKYEGDGMLFKGKLIGMEDLFVDRDEKICLDAMFKLKAVVKARGEHKQKVQVNLTMSAVKIIDDTTKAQIVSHEIERISFVVIDPRDTRAFGYVFNTADNRHQFWAIKTERAAAATVLALKELFEIAFEQYTNSEKAKPQSKSVTIEEKEQSTNETVNQPPPAASTTPSVFEIWESAPNTAASTTTTTVTATTTTPTPIISGDLWDLNAAPLPVISPVASTSTNPLDDLFGDLTLTQPAPLPPPPSTNALLNLPPPVVTTTTTIITTPSPPIGDLNLSNSHAPRPAPPPPILQQQPSSAPRSLSPVAPPSVTNPFSEFDFLSGLSPNPTATRPTKESFFPPPPPAKTIQQLQMEKQS